MRWTLLFLLLVFVIGCQVSGEVVKEEVPGISSLTLTTDMPLYHSNEMIHLNANLESMTDINATVRFYGINASRLRIDETIDSVLVKGVNDVSFDYQAPRCYGCAGVKPGTYQIAVDVISGNLTMATASVDVELMQ
ncbi:hypothetical protein KY337_01845 [Candidatus Woesearchaeota archaeon]|nr:hypothetical protein [Candidatus Woesearchaeota archaeon]